MPELTWQTIRDRAVRAFNGELPNPATEQDVIDAFEQNPQAVLRALDDVAESVTAGKARSGWAVWRSRCYGVHSSNDTTVTVEDRREKKIRAAESWVRNAGQHYDRDSEVAAALFETGGYLQPWRTDELLRERMLRLWREVRPNGEAIEVAAHADDQHYVRTTGYRWQLERAGRKAADAYAHRMGFQPSARTTSEEEK